MIRKLIIDTKKCVGCRSCIFSCPKKAISIVSNKAKINEKLCVSCGACLSVCPASAIKFK